MYNVSPGPRQKPYQYRQRSTEMLSVFPFFTAAKSPGDPVYYGFRKIAWGLHDKKPREIFFCRRPILPRSLACLFYVLVRIDLGLLQLDKNVPRRPTSESMQPPPPHMNRNLLRRTPARIAPEFQNKKYRVATVGIVPLTRDPAAGRFDSPSGFFFSPGARTIFVIYDLGFEVSPASGCSRRQKRLCCGI